MSTQKCLRLNLDDLPLIVVISGSWRWISWNLLCLVSAAQGLSFLPTCPLLRSWEGISPNSQVSYSRQHKAELKFFCWELIATQPLRKSNEGCQNASLLPSPMQREIRMEDVQSKLQCIIYICIYVCVSYIWFLKPHYFVLFAWAQIAFNLMPEKKTTFPVMTCWKAHCICLIMDFSSLSCTSLFISRSTSG